MDSKEIERNIINRLDYHFINVADEKTEKMVEEGQIDYKNRLKIRDQMANSSKTEYIKKRGGIEEIVKTQLLLEEKFEPLRELFIETKRLEFFKGKAKLEPALKEFYEVLKEHFTDVESSWEYRSYISEIFEQAYEGNKYPFMSEISHEIHESEPQKTLDILVRQVREEACTIGRGEYVFHHRCMGAQKVLNDLLTKYPEIENKSIDTQDDLNLPVYQHVFNLVRISGKLFVIDPTYIQFCTIDNTKDCLGIPGFPGAKPAHYLMDDDNQIKFLHELIRNGYFEATDENLKRYLDTFVLANRNSKFYKNHPSLKTTETGISSQEYVKVLLGKQQACWGNPEEMGALKSVVEGREH